MSLLARLLSPRPSAVQTPADSEAQRLRDPGALTGHRWSFRSAGRRLVGLLAQYQWWILGVAGVAAFVLGYIGSWEFLTEESAKAHVNFSDPAYLSLKGFILESTDKPGLPWQLDVARYFAPVVAGWATISALGLLFRDRVQQLKIPWMRGHVVICGLGEHVGIVFLRRLREARIRAVVVELNGDNPSIELCRSLGAPVIVGDAQRLKTLQAAGAHRARRVLAVTDDDAVNTQIVATWRELPGRRSGQLGCLARILDPDFCSLLRIQEAQRGDESTVDFFNIDEISARLMLKQFPLATDCTQPHILVAHLDPLGIWLVYHAARAWHDNRGDKKAPLMVTVLDHKPEESIQTLKSRHPELKTMCDFKPFRATAEDIGERLSGHHLDPATPHISRAYVTAYEDQQAFQTALKLYHQLHKLDPTVPVVVALSHPHGVASLLGDVKRAGALANIDVFPTMERACSVELVRGGSFEPLAEGIHDRWRAQQLKENKPAPSWEVLDESRKESNRAQARAIAVKLHSIHCAMAPLQNWDATKDFTFTEEELEKLAIDEHDRWWRERLDAGWKLIPMPQADDPDEVKRLLEEARRRKESPYLIPWADLLELDAEMDRRFGKRMAGVAEYDRIAVREIPKRLADVGLQVIRTDTIARVATKQTPTVGVQAART
ncbi:MAG: NAD-binding protein [Mycobacterium sp.]|uniref:NAD-binding protein n=1 Tax=Mycobacterium sp. TaxID=1785 RepID=UPI003F960F08